MDKLINRPMVYIDGTEKSYAAAKYGIGLARHLDIPLFALYVVNTRALEDLVKSKIFLAAEQDEYHKDIEHDADKYLKDIKNMAKEKKVELITLKKSGTVSIEIKSAIKEQDVDLLLLGSVSKSHSRRNELFDENDRAMRNVNCSVIIVRQLERVDSMYDSI